jgi:hypothetical protein
MAVKYALAPSAAVKKLDEAIPVSDVTSPILIGVPVAGPPPDPDGVVTVVGVVAAAVAAPVVVAVDDLDDELQAVMTRPTIAIRLTIRVVVRGFICTASP